MAVTDCEEVLMICLANVRSQHKVVLILLINIMNAKPLSCRISKPCDDIILDYFQSFLRLVFLNDEWVLFIVNDTVIVIDTLILKRRRLWNTWNQTLYRSCHWVIVHRELILYQWRRIWRSCSSLIIWRLFFSHILRAAWLIVLLTRFAMTLVFVPYLACG